MACPSFFESPMFHLTTDGAAVLVCHGDDTFKDCALENLALFVVVPAENDHKIAKITKFPFYHAETSLKYYSTSSPADKISGRF